MKGVVISVLVVLAMVQLMVKPGEATISCEEVVNLVRPCAPYIMTGIGSPTVACCNGLDQLRKSTTITTDKQQACQCAKDAVAGFTIINEQAAASLPAICKIDGSDQEIKEIRAPMRESLIKCCNPDIFMFQPQKFIDYTYCMRSCTVYLID